MIIGVSGRIGSGKDTIGEIIQKLCITNSKPEFEIKKYAGKLKQVASLLTGIPVESFEDQEFKKALLGAEWGTVRHNPLNAIPVFGDVKFNELMSVRELLQKLGTDAVRNGLHKDAWVNALFADYKLSEESIVRKTKSGQYYDKKEYPNWIITDMRFPNEMEAVVERKGITIRVVRPKIESLVDKMRPYSDLVHYGIPMPKEHPSETALDDAKFDYEIINDGTIEDLVSKVREILVKENII